MRLHRQVALTLLVGAPLYAQQPGPQDMPQEMVWVDRSGDVIERVGAVQNSIFFPEISPDGRSIAVSSRDGEVNDRDVWIHDIAAGTKRRVMEVKGNDNFPFWSPDGKEVAFTSSRTRNYELYRRSLASGAEDKRQEVIEGAMPVADGSPLTGQCALCRMDRGQQGAGVTLS